MKAIDVLRGRGLTADFARALVTELGEDAEDIGDDWRWEDIIKYYVDLVPAAEAWFSKALKDEKDIDVRREAAFALGMIGNVRAIPALRTALKDKAADVRGEAAVALGMIGDPKAIPALRTALKDKAADVRRYAAWALEECEKETK